MPHRNRPTGAMRAASLLATVSSAIGAPRRHARAWPIAGVYAIFAALWIYFSDSALDALVDDPAVLVRISVYKGIVFVAVTSLLLLALMSRAFRAIEGWYERSRVHEEQLATIIRSASDAIVAVDDAQRVVLVNPAAEKLFATTEAALLGRPIADLLPSGITTAASTGTRMAARRIDGTPLAVEVSVSHHEPASSAPTTLVLRDIGPRLAHEAEVARLQRLYAALSHINQAIVWSRERDELLGKVCRALVEQGGFRGAWVGWPHTTAPILLPAAHSGDATAYLTQLRIPIDDVPELQDPAGRAFRSGQPFFCNDLFTDPHTRPLRDEAAQHGIRAMAALPIRLRQEVCGLLTVYSDTSDIFREPEQALLVEAAADVSFALDNLAREEERRAAETRAENERRFSATMIESMPGVLYFYDTRGRFLRWNRNFALVSGYSDAEIAAMHPLDFFSADSRALLEERIAEVFARGESSVEAPFLARDGTRTPYFFTGRRVEFEGTTCLVGVGIDISERVRAQRALVELNESLEQNVARRTDELHATLVRAEAADRLKSAFLATMSHELRTPLNSIIGFTGIVLQGLAGPLNEEQAKQLGMVRGSARHLLELINDVLDISKIEAGQLEVKPAAFHVREAVERVVGSVRHMAERKGLVLSCSIDPSVVEIVSDRRRVEQILLNLLNNGIKFTPKGSVSLTVTPVSNQRFSNDARPSEAVRFIVADTGIGIKPADLATLFQPFRQIDSGIARQHEGTGLGLAICRKLATLLGGEITASSEGTRGSVFTVTLPVTPSHAP
jgi:PAS domain S-box-containing protein